MDVVSASMPPVSEVWKAIDAYLRIAYPDTPPSAVRARMRTLHSLEDGDFFDSDMFEKDSPDHPSRWALRLGNSHYPHMKLCIDRRPDKKGFVFRADAHDKHCCPARSSREYTSFQELMRQNQSVVQLIESEWESAGLPTFKAYLRNDLASRTPPAPLKLATDKTDEHR